MPNTNNYRPMATLHFVLNIRYIVSERVQKIPSSLGTLGFFSEKSVATQIAEEF